MTKVRKPLTFEEAVTKALATLGRDEAEKVTGKTYHIMIRWSDPDADGYRIPLHLAMALDVACARAGGGTPFKEAYRAQLAALLGSTYTGDTVHPMARLVEVTEELGDAAATIRAAACPTGPGGSRFTEREVSAGLAQIRELRDAVDALERDLLAQLKAHDAPVVAGSFGNTCYTLKQADEIERRARVVK